MAAGQEGGGGEGGDGSVGDHGGDGVLPGAEEDVPAGPEAAAAGGHHPAP